MKSKRQAIIDLLNTCDAFSPTPEISTAFHRIRSDLRAADEPEEKIVRALASALLDGLAHGNWPS